MNRAGKNPLVAAVLAFVGAGVSWWLVVALAFSAGQAGAEPGQAVSDGCGPGRHCKVLSLENGLPRARFPACVATRYGRQITDLDAGVLRMCQRDGGWSDVGGGSSSGGSGGGGSYWYDAGTVSSGQVIQADVTGLTLNSTASANGLVALRIEHPSLSDQGKAVFYGDATASTPLFFMSGNGGNPQLVMGGITSSGATLTVEKNLSNIAIQITGNSYYAAATPAGSTAIMFDNAGARLRLSAGGGGDNLFSDGSNVVTGGGLKIGGSSASAIASSYRGTFALDAGAIAAETCQDNTVSVPGCNPGAECVVGWAQGQPTGGTITIGCRVNDSNDVKARVCNVGASAAAPQNGTYSVRCFNP